MNLEYINKPEVLNLLKQANTKNKLIKNKIRKQLFNKLLPLYKRIKKRNIRQFHFQLPNCESFLRFHNPLVFGDNLKNFRYSMKKANSKLIPVKGFEEGRTFNGFRNVFPIISNKKHLGSIEISLDFNSFKKELEKLFKKEYILILKKDVVLKKVFKSNRNFYKKSSLCDSFLIEQSLNLSKHLKFINKKIHGKIHKKLQNGLTVIKSINYKNENYLILFMPLKNTENKHVGYILSYSKDNTIYHAFIQFIITSIVTILLLTIITFTIFIITIKNKKLKLAAKKAEENAAAKTQFLANMSHEIRTQINAIIGYTDMTMETKITSEQNDYLTNISNAGTKLLSIIDSILDFSKFTIGKTKIIEKEYNLNGIIKQIISINNISAIEKGIDLSFEIPSLDKYIITDANRLSQILTNLISNSIKFTEKGSVNLVVKIEKQTDSDVTLKFIVKDTGIGISKKNQQHIFDSFSQANNSISQKFGGTGLGLAISNELILLFGGKP